MISLNLKYRRRRIRERKNRIPEIRFSDREDTIGVARGTPQTGAKIPGEAETKQEAGQAETEGERNLIKRMASRGLLSIFWLSTRSLDKRFYGMEFDPAVRGGRENLLQIPRVPSKPLSW